MSSIHVARQGFVTKSALPSVSRERGTTTVADNRTVLLLNGNGTNGAQNNTFLDSSTNNFSITRNGNATQGSYSPFTLPDGQWSNYFDGTGDTLTGASNAALSPSTGAFTFEVSFYVESFPVNSALFTLGTQTNGLQIGRRDASSPADWGVAQAGVAWRLTSTTLPTENQWNHMVVVRDGSNNMSLFLNGTRLATTNTSFTFTQNGFNIGNICKGYFSNLRYVVGTAIYNPTLTTLTVPTAPLTAVSGTQLLTCQTNRFKDNSSNNATITRNGDVRVTPWSPFAPTSAYDPATNGGSGYFDGTGDFLNTATSGTTLSGDFTIEGWVYINALGATRPLVCVGDDFQSTGAVFYVSSTGRLGVYGNNTALLTGTTQTVAVSSWNHIAFVRSSGTITLYLNGVADSTTASNSTSFAGIYRVGAEFYNGSLGAVMNGYIANFRTVAGTAVYTANFTPPTAPVTNITNTSLLLNFTNAGIFDTAGDQIIETVADAKLSTAVTKFGSASMLFDGTGDFLRMASSPLFNQNGPYTVEMWLYSTTSQTSKYIYSQNTTNFCQLAIDSSGRLIIDKSGVGTQVTASTALATNTWVHVAMVSNGTTLALYVNGVSQGTASVGSTAISTQTVTIGAYQGTGGLGFIGYIDDLRVTLGQARYTSTFTPPTAELAIFGTVPNIVNNSTYGVYQLA